jgi:5-methylcytosine-specific restriction endonuclease McrA
MPYKDAEKRRAYGREWMKRNPERAREAMRRWRARHPEEHKLARDGYDATHPESASARRKRYRQAHPEVRRVITQLRRARLAGAGGKYTAREWADLVLRYQGRCAYCGAAVPLQPDHRIPLALGGSNRIENILPACGRCNRRKHLMSEADFRARLARDGQMGQAPSPEL